METVLVKSERFGLTQVALLRQVMSVEFEIESAYIPGPDHNFILSGHYPLGWGSEGVASRHLAVHGDRYPGILSSSDENAKHAARRGLGRVRSR